MSSKCVLNSAPEDNAKAKRWLILTQLLKHRPDQALPLPQLGEHELGAGGLQDVLLRLHNQSHGAAPPLVVVAVVVLLVVVLVSAGDQVFVYAIARWLGGFALTFALLVPVPGGNAIVGRPGSHLHPEQTRQEV